VSVSPFGRAGWSRWLLVGLLAVSLGVNVFLGGVFTGRRLFRPPPNPDMMVSRVVEHLSASLSPVDSTALHRVFDSHRRQFGERFAALRRAHAMLRDAMAAQPFDRAGLNAALDAVDRERAALGGVFHAALLEAATEMSPAGRQILAEQDPLRP
jgi:uncharacterized membrane protein